LDSIELAQDGKSGFDGSDHTEPKAIARAFRRLSGRVQRAEKQQPAETELNGAWLRRLARDTFSPSGLRSFEMRYRDVRHPDKPEDRSDPWLSMIVRGTV
jgi:hypothetical protein